MQYLFYVHTLLYNTYVVLKSIDGRLWLGWLSSKISSIGGITFKTLLAVLKPNQYLKEKTPKLKHRNTDGRVS